MKTLTDRVITESGKIILSVITLKQKEYINLGKVISDKIKSDSIKRNLSITYGKTESGKNIIHIKAKDNGD